MFEQHITTRSCTIYGGHGDRDVEELALELDEPDDSPPDARHVLLRQVMCSDLVCVRADLAIENVLELLVRNHLGCLPVVDALRKPIGVITKFDVVEQIDMFTRAVGDALPPELLARTAEEVMMPLALTLDDDSTLSEAAEMMTDEDTHHVLVTSPDGTLVGVVSAKDIVGWLVQHEGTTH